MHITISNMATIMLFRLNILEIDFWEIPLFASSLVGLVLIKPSGVISNIQEKIAAIGKPIASRTTTNVTVQDGKERAGVMISTTSKIIKAVAAYRAKTLNTFLRFNSCQNWDSLFKISGS